MWDTERDAQREGIPQLRLAHSAGGEGKAARPEMADSARYPEQERLSARGAQRLMQGIFNLGYGTAGGRSDRAWMEDALCAQTDPDIFYPEKGGSTAPATSVCNNCSVRAECLEYAVSNDIRHGIWGGTSDNDRKRMARERRLRLAAQGGSR